MTSQPRSPESVKATPSVESDASARPRMGKSAAWLGMAGFQEMGLVVVVLVLGIGLALLAAPINLPDGSTINGFLNADNLGRNILVYMSWVAIMALGATLVIISGGIDISVGSTFCLCALGCAAALNLCGENASPWLVIPVGVVVPLAIGAICGFINGAIVVGVRMHPFIVTLATLSIFRGIAVNTVPMQTVPVNAEAFTNFINASVALPGKITLEPWPIILMLACGAAVWVYLSHTVGGRQIYAVGGNEEAARFSGLPVGRIKLRVYVLCGLLAGVAGMISTGFFASANTSTGDGYELIVIASAVVGGASLDGGRGTALGAVLGALIIKLIENGIAVMRPINLGLFTLKLSKQYSMIIVGVAILLAVGIDRFSEHLRARRAKMR